MREIIDLSQETYTGIPVYHALSPVTVSMYASRKKWKGLTDSDSVTS